MTSPLIDLRVNGRVQPIAIGTTEPEFSWKLPEGSTAQSHWEIQVSKRDSFEAASLVWSSGKQEGSAPYGVSLLDTHLVDGSVYHWRVRAWLIDEEAPTSWTSAVFETGMIDPDAWQAQWVGAPEELASADAPLYLQGSGQIGADVVRARAYVSSLGWHRLFVNGQDITGTALVPRWTPFDQEVEYVGYDVTDALKTGTNVVSLVVGDGRFRGSNGFENHHAVYGDRLAGLVRIVAEAADGTSTVIVTDRSWVAGRGRITASDPKTGEHADLRVDDASWLHEAPPSAFRPVAVLPEDRTLVAESVEPVRQVDELRPVSITRLTSGAQVVDFGQNFAGIVKLRLTGPAGTAVTLTHSEIRKPNGSLDLNYIHPFPFGRWYQRDTVTLDGTDTEWQPWFTIHGFRYVEVAGLAHSLTPDDISGIVLSSDLRQTGSFESSNANLNQLWHNVEWSLRSNFMDTSTDCPTRERSGWTGDIQVFAPTATAFVDAQQFLRRYLHNLTLEQHPDGTIPVVIPSAYSDFSGGAKGQLKSAGTAAGWGDASVLVPWTLYEYYGDTKVLADQYESAVAWVEQCERRAQTASSRARRRNRRRRPEVEQYIVDTGFQFGEWLRPGEGALASVTDARRRGTVVATAYLAHSAQLLSQIAGVLEHDADQARFEALAHNVRQAWRAAFLRGDGSIGTDRQDDYVRALAFGLLEESERPSAAARLVALINKSGGHLGTGFLSTPLLLNALVDAGYAEIAWNLLLQTSNPSWMHQIDRGATTTWETWEGYTRSGKAKMSHNHYAFGSVARFLVERIAGITPLEPGYAVIGIQPLVGGGLTSAQASIETPYGTVSSAWRQGGDEIEAEITVPPGTTARFQIGSANQIEELQPGHHTIRRPLH